MLRLELEWLIRCGPGNPAWATMHIGGMPVHDGLEKLGHRYEHFPLPVSAFSHELLTVLLDGFEPNRDTVTR